MGIKTQLHHAPCLEKEIRRLRAMAGVQVWEHSLEDWADVKEAPDPEVRKPPAWLHQNHWEGVRHLRKVRIIAGICLHLKRLT